VECGLVARVAVVALVAGCAVNTKAVRTDQALDATSAYAYGRFIIKAAPSDMALADSSRPDNQTVGLLIRCNNGRTYPLLFSPERVVRVVKIQPAKCAIREIQYVDDMGIIRGSKPPPSPWVHLDYFAAGHGYYLGDFFAVASRERVQVYPARFLLTWDMDPIDDHFAETTAEMRKHFKALAALPIHDKRLAPQRPAPKHGLAGPDEPLMSPERISRLAGFVKTTFATPAACEAACGTGDCLPYRASSGAAMTCIVHCTTNGDCPTTMACNCHSGTDCQAVAETPGDSMEGICIPVDPGPARSEPAHP
jgi:hypothetical protein